MNLLQDIKDILKDDKEHNLKIEVSQFGVKILLDYDPGNDYEEKIILPIEYTTLEEFAYIPDDEYRKMYNANDYGIDLPEIILAKNIMEYLESHKEEIHDLCSGYAWEFRNDDW